MEKRVLHEQLRNAWRGRERAIPIRPILHFAPQGLVLGAGTLLVAADGSRRLRKLPGQEARVLALLAAAHNRPIAPGVLGNIERAAKAWSEGDDCLAYIHLAHAGLPPLQDHEAARRLFMADRLMKAGTPPRDIVEALGLHAAFADRLEKLYNEEEARVPKGSGRPSGEWTDSEEAGGGDAAGRAGAAEGRAYESPPATSMPLRTASFLSKLDAAQLIELGLYAARLVTAAGGAAAAFGLLFIPSPNDVHVEGEVPDIPGLRYSWNRDETLLHLTYGHGGAQRTFALHLDDDVVRDDNGRKVGVVIGGNRIAIDTLAVLPDLVQQDQPRLCPAPGKDVPGSDRGKKYEENWSRQYEDFMKLLINPPPMGPTPSGFVYYLPNPEEGDKPVSFDDCKWTNGILFEFKGRYGKLLTFPSQAVSSFLSQSLRQINASGGRPVVWVFAEEEDAKRARKLLEDAGEGRERITVVHVPRIIGGSR